MTLQRRDRLSTRGVVAGRVEVEAETTAERAVALRAEIGTRLGEREVDVEHDRFDHNSHSATWSCHAPLDHATVCAIVQPRARSRSSPSSDVSRSNR